MHRDTILTPAIGFALLALTAVGAGSTLSTAATAQAVPSAQTQPQTRAQPQMPATPQTSPQPQAAPAAPPQGAGAQSPGAQAPGSRPAGTGQAVGTAGGRGAAQVGRPRRRSYAACNRISHTRGLRGGARRRFLVRCKLGYDRPRNGQPQGTRQP